MNPKKMKEKESITKEGWESKSLGQESIYEGETEMKRRMARGDESKGDPDERDDAGGNPYIDTAQGRQEAGEAIQAQSRERIKAKDKK